MREIRTEVDVAAPIADVWRVVADLAAYEAWNPFLTRFDAEPRVGAKGRLTAAMAGRKPRSTPVTILAADEPRVLGWRGQLLAPWLFAGTHFIELAPAAGGTRVINREEFRGILAPLLLRALGASFPAGYEAMNAALKRRVEGGA